MVRKKYAMFFIAVAALVSIINAQPSPDGANGQVRASFEGVHSPGLDTSEFAERITEALNLIAGTLVAEDAASVPVGMHGATAENLATFQAAIDTAQARLDYFDSLEIIGTFSPGDSFEMSLRIENNTGFASMGIRVHVPEGLVLTHVSIPALSELNAIPPPGFDPATGAITPIIGPRYAFVGFFGIEDFTLPESDLPVYTFRVTEDADIWRTSPITVAFASIHGILPPTNADGVPKDILLPNDNGALGGIIIERTAS